MAISFKARGLQELLPNMSPAVRTRWFSLKGDIPGRWESSQIDCVVLNGQAFVIISVGSTS